MFLSDDDMVECPYNKTHRMLRKRLQSHLLKCRVHYPDVELRKCPFNITHLIPEPEFTHHATNCPDRKLITQYKYDAPVQKEEDGPKHAPIECDEDWDDTDVNDYNPRLYLDKANVIRNPDGVSRSERKLFIKKERKRLGDGDNSSDEETKSGVPSPGKRQRQDSYDSVDDDDYAKEARSRNYRSKRSESPSTSNRNRSRSPTSSRKSFREHSPGAFSKRGSRNTNYRFNSGRGTYYNSGSKSQAYSGNIETDTTMPEAPPPPMISYPSPRSYFPKPPPFSDL